MSKIRLWQLTALGGLLLIVAAIVMLLAGAWGDLDPGAALGRTLFIVLIGCSTIVKASQEVQKAAHAMEIAKLKAMAAELDASVAARFSSKGSKSEVS